MSSLKPQWSNKNERQQSNKGANSDHISSKTTVSMEEQLLKSDKRVKRELIVSNKKATKERERATRDHQKRDKIAKVQPVQSVGEEVILD